MVDTSTIEGFVAARNLNDLYHIVRHHGLGHGGSRDSHGEAQKQLSCILTLVERDLNATPSLVSAWIKKVLTLPDGDKIVCDVLREKIEDHLCISPSAMEASILELQAIYLARRTPKALTLESHKSLYGSSHYRTILADAVDVNAYYFVDDMLRCRKAPKDDPHHAPPSVARVGLKLGATGSVEQYDLLQYAALMGDDRMIDLVRSHLPEGCGCTYLSMGEQVLRHLGLAGNRPALRSYTDDGFPLLASAGPRDHVSAFDCAMRYIDAGAQFADGPSAWQKVAHVTICESHDSTTMIPLEYAIQKSTTYADAPEPKTKVERLISRIATNC